MLGIHNLIPDGRHLAVQGQHSLRRRGEGYEDAVLNIQNEFYEVYYNGSLEELEDFGRRLDKLAALRKVQGLHTFTELGV